MSGVSDFLQALCPEIVRRASPETARGLVMAAGSLYFAVNTGERRRIEEGVRDLLGPGARAERAKREVFGHILDHYFEKLLVTNRSMDFLRDFVGRKVTTEGLGALDAALERGRGAIAVTAHWGAVELVPPLLALRGYPVTIVMEARNPVFRRSLERLAAGRDVELLIASRGDRVLEGIFAALEKGRVLITQVDEVDSWRRRRSRIIRLFGKSLFFDHSLDFIAKRSGSPSVAIFCKRLPRLRYSLRCEELAPDPAAEDVALKAMRLWERRTLEDPEQWFQWAKWKLMKVDAAS
jgi:lauroyl/myristoyl acyltransferase